MDPREAAARNVSSRARGAAVKDMLRDTIRRTRESISDAGDSMRNQEALLPGAPAPSDWWNPGKDVSSSLHMVRSSWLNLLILACPLGILSPQLGWNASSTFLLNLSGLIPLALLLGEVTEDLALRLGEVMGGLLNATFGNVVEIILSIAALQAGLYDVVSSSLLGSILSNLLLVLGMSFFAGGLRYKMQTFNATASDASSSLLFLSSISILLPTAALHLGLGGDDPAGLASDKVLLLSRLVAVALLMLYAAYLYFQLGTHAEYIMAPSATVEEGEEEDEAEEPMLTLTAAIIWLTGITVLVAVCSEFLTGSIEEVSHTWGLSQSFLGFIILPIAGNACEHITAVFVAYRNKMDLALGVAIGSSLQIGLFAVPFITVVGWATGHAFSLAFDPFAALVLLLSVLHANFTMGDSRSNWLEGVQLLVTYFIIAATYAMTSA